RPPAWAVVAARLEVDAYRSRAGVGRRVRAAALASARAASLSIASSTVPALAGQQTFTSTGAEQQFTVPAGVVILHLTLVGAPGATGSNVGGTGGAGANGARVTADLAVSPGDTLFVEVGGAGSTASGGGNGGERRRGRRSLHRRNGWFWRLGNLPRPSRFCRLGGKRRRGLGRLQRWRRRWRRLLRRRRRWRRRLQLQLRRRRWWGRRRWL